MPVRNRFLLGSLLVLLIVTLTIGLAPIAISNGIRLWVWWSARQQGFIATIDKIEAMIVPPDLLAALKAKPVALRNFEAFPRSSRKQFLYWVNGGKREETRKHRIKIVVELASKNERLTPEAIGRRVPPSRGGSRKRTRRE